MSVASRPSVGMQGCCGSGETHDVGGPAGTATAVMVRVFVPSPCVGVGPVRLGSVVDSRLPVGVAPEDDAESNHRVAEVGVAMLYSVAPRRRITASFVDKRRNTAVVTKSRSRLMPSMRPRITFKVSMMLSSSVPLPG